MHRVSPGFCDEVCIQCIRFGMIILFSLALGDRAISNSGQRHSCSCLIRPEALKQACLVRSQERAELVVFLSRWALLHQPELTAGSWHRSKSWPQGGRENFNTTAEKQTWTPSTSQRSHRSNYNSRMSLWCKNPAAYWLLQDVDRKLFSCSN